MTLTREEVVKFVEESNRIEGIFREPTKREIDATEAFLALDEVSVVDLENLVSVYADGAPLRRGRGMNVRVGDHFPLPGGDGIEKELRLILNTLVGEDCAHPHDTHLAYENLHPFMDGNGRSGRALWAWQMVRQKRPFARIGFLHSFYYQTLERSRQ